MSSKILILLLAGIFSLGVGACIMEDQRSSSSPGEDTQDPPEEDESIGIANIDDSNVDPGKDTQDPPEDENDSLVALATAGNHASGRSPGEDTQEPPPSDESLA